MFQCGEKEWRDRDFIGLAAILSGHALDGIGCLPSVNLKRIGGESDLDYRGRLMARLMEIGGVREAG